MDLQVRIIYMLAVLGVGIAARSVGLLGDSRTELLNRSAFYVALPALVFVSTASEQLGTIFSRTLVIGLWIVLFTTAGISWFLHRRQQAPASRAVAIVQSYHSNFGYLGLPFVAATLGSAAAAKASLILGIGALTQVPLTVLVLTSLTDRDASLGDELGKVVTNPVILALAAGIVVSATGTSVPVPAMTGLGYLAALALPIALLCVGSSMELQLPTHDFGMIGTVVGTKVVFMPAVAWIVFTWIGATPLTLKAGVVMFGAPTAVSTYIYAGELGGDERLASTNIFVTTVVSFLTLFAIVRLLG
jgi:predicted permease